MLHRTFSARALAGLLSAVASAGLVSGCGASDTPAKADAPSTETSAAAPSPTPTWPQGDAKGTLANPYRVGDTIVDGDWSIVIDSVNLNANDEVHAMNSTMALADPDPGNTWVTIHATWTYDGDKPDDNAGTEFALVPPNWSGDLLGTDHYGTTFNNVSTLGDGETSAAPATKGFSDTDVAILQAPTNVATDQAMVSVVPNYSTYHHYLVAVK